jgi:hypothetical protein
MPALACLSGAAKYYNRKRILAGRDLPQFAADSIIKLYARPR